MNEFNTSTLKQFSEKNNFFKKLEYLFLSESTKNQNAIFPYKTALSEASVKINWMGSTKWTYHKEWSFASYYFTFSKISFQFKNLVIKSWFDVPTTQMFIFIIWKHWSFTWRYFFPVSVLIINCDFCRLTFK